MKLRSHSLALFAMLLFGTVSVMGGCATTGMDRSVKASNSIKDVDSEIRKMNIQIDATAASLDILVVADKSDLKKRFDNYSDNVEKLEKEGRKVLERLDEMKLRNSQYFTEWEKEGDSFTNSEIRELSEQRRIKLAETYARVPAAGAGIKGSYRTYLTDLQEIQKYLSNDLTPKGIQAVTPVANRSVQDLNALKSSLTPVVAALDEIKAEMYTGKK